MANTHRNDRLDHRKGLRGTYEKNRRIVLASADVCALCGQPLDRTKKYPHPLATTLDHIVPISRGGDPIDMANMQAVHWKCNLNKRAKMMPGKAEESQTETIINNQDLPLHYDWTEYRSER